MTDGRSAAGPESCAETGNGLGEALTGVRVGQDNEPRNMHTNPAPTHSVYGEGKTVAAANARLLRAGGVNDPVHARRFHLWESGDPPAVRGNGSPDRAGNPIGARQR